MIILYKWLSNSELLACRTDPAPNAMSSGPQVIGPWRVHGCGPACKIGHAGRHGTLTQVGDAHGGGTVYVAPGAKLPVD